MRRMGTAVCALESKGDRLQSVLVSPGRDSKESVKAASLFSVFGNGKSKVGEGYSWE